MITDLNKSKLGYSRSEKGDVQWYDSPNDKQYFNFLYSRVGMGRVGQGRLNLRVLLMNTSALMRASSLVTLSDATASGPFSTLLLVISGLEIFYVCVLILAVYSVELEQAEVRHRSTFINVLDFRHFHVKLIAFI